MRVVRRFCLATVMVCALASATACTDAGISDPQPSGPQTNGADADEAEAGTNDPEPSEDRPVGSGGLAREAILPESQLPEDWRYATDEQFLGKPEMCGVLLEPPGLKNATTQRFTNVAGSDRFVIQYSFESDDETATAERLDEFAAAAPSCTSFSPGPGVELTVEPITDISPIGESFGAIHAFDADNPANKRDYLAFHNGNHVTVLLSYGLQDLASHTDLAKMAEAINSHSVELTK